MPGRRVLITGVGSYLGSLLAARLEDEPGFDTVFGLDDILDPVLPATIAAAEVDTVVHNSIIRQPGPGMSERAMHDTNVVGSLQLLAACEQAPTIRSIVIRGSAGVYGAEPVTTEITFTP